jgi:adenylate cyclase
MSSLGIPPRLRSSVHRALGAAGQLPIPLWAKLSVLIVSLLALTVALVSGFHLHRQQRTLEGEMQKRGRTIAEHLAASARTALLTRDELALALIVRDVARDTDVAYVVVTDRSGRIVAHSDLGRVGRPFERPESARAADGGLVVQPVALAGQDDVLEFSTPLDFRRIRVGTAYVGFNRAGIRSAVSDARRRATLITLAMLAVGMVGAVALSTMLSRPIVRLMQATRAVAAGDFAVSVPVTSNDEVGSLTRAFNEMAHSLREKEMIKRAFSRYVAREVVDEILKHPDRLALTGERRDVTVLFCDIRGFTATTETMRPEDVVELLNQFYDLMIETTFKYDGTLDKFLGDGVMAIFGAPLYRADHAVMAARTALAMQAAVAQLSASRVAAGKTPVSVGIGLNAGEAIAGTVGTSERMEYTVIGDCVNLAARLQARAAPGQILVAADTCARLNGVISGRALGRLAFKGKEDLVDVWEHVGHQSQ